MKLHQYNTMEEMVPVVAAEMINIARESIADRGRFILAISGGNSPKALYQYLSRLSGFPWEQTILLLVDERHVPPHHPDSNCGMVQRLLLKRLPIKPRVIFPEYDRSYDQTVQQYREKIENLFHGEPPKIDLILLGIGPDGHTASLFPDQKLPAGDIAKTEAPEQFAVKNRITFTLNLINRSGKKIFLTAGSGRKEVIDGVVSGDQHFPASLVEGGEIYHALE